MAGSKITLQSAFTAPTGKTLSLEAVMPPVQGAVLLIDAASSVGGLGGSSPPVAGTMFPNIAFAQAAAMAGGGDQSTLSPTFSYGTGGAHASVGIERTPKGGLHVAARQDVIAANDGAAILFPSSIQTLLYNNRAHAFYISFWRALTRAITSGSPGLPLLGILGTTTPSSNYLGYFRDATTNLDLDKPPSGDALRLGRRAGPGAVNALGAQFRNLAENGQSGAPAAISPYLASWAAGNSGYSSAIVSAPGGAASSVFYRCYIEDLTVSGRSYADVDAIDYALFVKEVMTAGGKYYGDSWTAPATLAGA